MKLFPIHVQQARAGRASLRTSALAITALLAAPVATAQAAPPLDFTPTANLQLDAAWLDRGDHSASEQDVRRARAGFKLAHAGGRWAFVADHDFAENSPPDAYLEFTPSRSHAFRLGQFKQPFLLEDAVSDKNSVLLEPSLLGAFAISRRLGLEYATAGEHSVVKAAVFSQKLDGSNESTGATVRALAILHAAPGKVAHVGFSLASEDRQDHTASFSGSAGNTLLGGKVASTGTIDAVDRLDRGGLEALWIHQAWSAQAEVAAVTARRAGQDFTGHGANVLVTWSPSGHSRSYKQGSIGAPATSGEIAWELGMRASTIDLDDSGIAGGRADSYGVSAIAYFSKNVRVLADLVRTERRGAEEDPTVAGLRLQLTY